MDVRRAHYCTLALIAVSVLISVVAWFMLPDRVATHFDANWQPDRFGPKMDVLTIGPGLMTVVALVSYVFCSLSREGLEESGIEPYLGVFLILVQVFLLGLGVFILMKVR